MQKFPKVFCYVLGKSFTGEKTILVIHKNYLVMKIQNALDYRNPE